MSETISPNSTIAQYTIVSKIGEGGMGEVYRARDERLDRNVAIKILPANFATDADRLTRFEQEARATSALNHPNILTVYDIGTHDGSPYFVAELLEGEELRDRLDHGSIPLRKVIEYAQQIVSGLEAAHGKGIVHRDLKPENLFITEDERVKILDFGIAKLSKLGGTATGSEDATRKVLTNPGVVMGTVGYMSPEQVRGQTADQRSDIFSFGAILHEMIELTRKPDQIFGCCLPKANRNLTYSSTPFSESAPRFSPDGKFVAYVSQDQGRPEVFVQTFPASGNRWQISNNGGRAPAWRGDGKEIFFVSGDNKHVFAGVTTGNGFEVGIPKPLFDLVSLGALSFGSVNFAASLDGQQFLITHQRETVVSLQYVVVQNWVSEKKCSANVQ